MTLRRGYHTGHLPVSEYSCNHLLAIGSRSGSSNIATGVRSRTSFLTFNSQDQIDLTHRVLVVEGCLGDVTLRTSFVSQPMRAVSYSNVLCTKGERREEEEEVEGGG